MSTRTVRLDNDAEKALSEIRRQTGMSISEALERGLLVLRERIAQQASERPWAVYERLDLGEGGYAAGPSDETRRTARDVIRRKHRR